MRKGVIVASLLAGLLAVGLVGGVVLAQSDGDGAKAAEKKSKVDRDGVKDEVMGRVAEILGIEQSALEDAFDQALTEQAEAKGAEMLASLVEKGILTQEQADAYQAWLDARPDGDLPVMGALGVFSRGKGPGRLGEDKAAGLLAKLVESGELTQAQADAYQAWLDAMPEIDFSAFPKGERRGDKKEFGEWGEGRKGMHGLGEWSEGNWSGSLVEKGILTQEQADAQRAWMESRPDIDIPIMGVLAALGPEIRAKGMELNEDTPSEWLAKLVENGTLTQAEADAYQAWLDERPEGAFFDPRAFGELGEGFGFTTRWEHANGAKR